MGNYLAEKRRKMEESQNLNRLSSFKIEEREATFPRELICMEGASTYLHVLWKYSETSF